MKILMKKNMKSQSIGKRMKVVEEEVEVEDKVEAEVEMEIETERIIEEARRNTGKNLRQKMTMMKNINLSLKIRTEEKVKEERKN